MKSTYYGLFAGFALAALSVSLLFNSVNMENAILIAFGIGLSGFGFIKYGYEFLAKQKLNRQMEFASAEIYFTESSILYNNELIELSNNNHKLRDFQIVEMFDMKMFQVTIQAYRYRKSNYHYLIPIPFGKLQEGERLRGYYRQKITYI